MSENTATQSQTDTDSTSPDQPRSAPGYPFLFRWLHWVLTVSGIVLILTGISMHAGSRPEWSLLDGKVPGWFWTGRVHYWHAWAALFFTPAVIAACWVYVRRRVYFRVTHLILLVGGVLTVISGFFLANPPASALVYSASLWVHAIVGLVVIPVWFAWHVLTGVTRYVRALIPAFDPISHDRLWPIAGLLVFSAITSCILLNGWPFSPPWRDLVAGRVDGPTATEMATLPWDEAKPLKVQMANGNAMGTGMDAGRTPLELRALHDGSELFIRAVWADDDEEYNYWPWEKTDDGWNYMQTSANDECRCYEDKFSMVFPVQPDGDFHRFGCAASCHVHEKYGWGYKGTSRLIDVWHWKSARTGSVGQVDDKYWSVADFDNKDIGRHGDPKEGGGYTKNRAEDKGHPLYLPKSPEAEFTGWIVKGEEQEYTDELAGEFETGQKVAGVVSEAFLGDRGNVSCQSEWKDGYWTLYIRRQLDTGSDYDAQFAPGGRYAFGCAAFDHSGKRHAYALPTFHLVVAE